MLLRARGSRASGAAIDSRKNPPGTPLSSSPQAPQDPPSREISPIPLPIPSRGSEPQSAPLRIPERNPIPRSPAPEPIPPPDPQRIRDPPDPTRTPQKRSPKEIPRNPPEISPKNRPAAPLGNPILGIFRGEGEAQIRPRAGDPPSPGRQRDPRGIGGGSSCASLGGSWDPLGGDPGGMIEGEGGISLSARFRGGRDPESPG